MSAVIEHEGPSTDQPDRRTYLGSADIAAIVGLHPDRTPLQVYLAKKNGEPEPSKELKKLFRRGKLMEPVARSMAIEDFDLQVIGVNRRFTHPDFPWAKSEIDFETVTPEGVEINNEVKSVHHSQQGQWGEEGTDEIPIHYWAQVQYALGITNRPRATVWALFGLDDLVQYTVNRDDDVIADFMTAAESFWNDCVLRNVPPPPVNSDDLDFLHLRRNGTPVEADEETLLALSKLKALKAAHKVNEDAIEDLEFQIQAAMCRGLGLNPTDDPTEDSLSLVSGGKTLLTWKRQGGMSCRWGDLRRDHPVIAAPYINSYEHRVMRLKEK